LKIFYLSPVNIAMLNKNLCCNFYRNSTKYLIRMDHNDKTYFHRFKKAGISGSRPCLIKLRDVSCR